MLSREHGGHLLAINQWQFIFLRKIFMPLLLAIVTVTLPPKSQEKIAEIALKNFENQ